MKISTRARRQGFTMLELVISVAIMMSLAVIILPQWGRYRTKQDANQAAHTMAADLRRLSTMAVHNENYAYLQINNNLGYTLYAATATPGPDGIIGTADDLLAYAPLKVVNLTAETSRARISPATGTVAFGPKGWVLVPPAGATPATTSLTVGTDAVDGSSYYPITISSGANDLTFVVRVYINGRVKVL